MIALEPKQDRGRRVYLPTPAEIRERCREIQATWDARTEYERRVCKGSEWQLPTMDDRQREG